MPERRSPPRRRLAILLAALLVALAFGGGAALAQGGAADPAALRARYARPDSIPFPADNPYSEAKARLGHALFFDPRLSGSNAMSCASCHNPALGWEDGLPTGRGRRRIPSTAPPRPS